MNASRRPERIPPPCAQLLIIGFDLTSTTIKSAHLSYTIPPQYQYVIKPHKAIGDAARMFLVDMEFGHYQKETCAGIKDHILQYEKAREAARIQREEEQGAVSDERNPNMP